MDAATLYTLIIVTNAGMVSVTPNIKSLEMCLEAKQLAETGRSVAEEKTYQEARHIRDDNARAANVAAGRVVAEVGEWHVVSPSEPKLAKCVIDVGNK